MKHSQSILQAKYGFTQANTLYGQNTGADEIDHMSGDWARIMAKSTATNFEILMWTSTNASGTFELFVLSGILSLACNFIHCVFEEIERIIMPLLEKGSLELPPWQTISAEESTCLATSRQPRKAAATCSLAPAKAGRAASTVTGAERPRTKTEAATLEHLEKGSLELPQWPTLGAAKCTCRATSRQPRKAAATSSVTTAKAGRAASTVTGAERPRATTETVTLEPLEKGSLELPQWPTLGAAECTGRATSRQPRKAAATFSVAPANAGRAASTVTGAGRPRKKAEAATFEPQEKGSFTLPERVSWPFLAGYPKKTLSESGHSFTYLEKGVKESGSRAFFLPVFGGPYPYLALLPFQSGELSPYVAKRPV